MFMNSLDSDLLDIKRISISQLKELTGDYSISHIEAEEIIDSLVKLSLIAYEINNTTKTELK